jgi:predicted DNA-binding transcriptional regulator AlpA
MTQRLNHLLNSAAPLNPRGQTAASTEKALPRWPAVGSLSGFPEEFSRHRVLNTAEAAAFLNFSVPHFRRLYRSGGVPPPIQLSTRKLGWKMADLVDWIATRESRPVQI